MTIKYRIIFYCLLILSLLSLLLSVNTALICLLVTSILTLTLLCLKPTLDEKSSKAIHWWGWSIHFLVLIGLYMATYGVANIVGSGRKFSARMAVSTLRTVHWAQRQCISVVDRACHIKELKGELTINDSKTSLLPTNFKSLDIKSDQTLSYGQRGQYLVLISTTSEAEPSSWVAYAWPAVDQTLQTFCIDHNEEILELPIQEGKAVYVGMDKRPLPRACLGSLHQDPNPPLTSLQEKAIAEGKKPPPSTHQGEDQQTWQRWRGKRTRISKAIKE